MPRPLAKPSPSHDVISRIAGARATGAVLATVSSCVGIPRRTLTGWTARGRADVEAGRLHTPHARLVRALDEAEHVARAELRRRYRLTASECERRRLARVAKSSFGLDLHHDHREEPAHA